MNEQSPKTAYRIRNWTEHFETSESRKRVGNLQWVAMPTKQDGRRFRRLSRHEKATDIFGAWCLIVEAAAKMPIRGVLIDDRGEPLGALDLADLTGFPESSFEQALDVLSSDAIGWLETVDLLEPAGTCCDLPESAGTHLLHNHTQPDQTTPDRTKQNNTEPNPTHEKAGLVDKSLSGGGGGGGGGGGSLAGPMASIMRSVGRVDRNDLDRHLAVQSKLSQLGVTGDVQRELYNRRDITVELIDREWQKIQRDTTIDDPVAILIHRLRQYGKPRKPKR